MKYLCFFDRTIVQSALVRPIFLEIRSPAATPSVHNTKSAPNLKLVSISSASILALTLVVLEPSVA